MRRNVHVESVSPDFVHSRPSRRSPPPGIPTWVHVRTEKQGVVHWGFGLIDVGRRDRFGRFDATYDVPTSSIGHRVSLFFSLERMPSVRQASDFHP